MVCVFPLLSLAAATTPSGDPTLKPGLDPASVTPGLPGFLATLLVVVVVVFLIRDMVRRVRRVRYTAEVEQSRALRAQQSAGGPPTGDAADGPAADRAPHYPDATDPLRPGGKHGPDNR